MKCVETLAAQERCDCWNVPDKDRRTPITRSIQQNKIEIIKVLLKYDRIQLDKTNKNGGDLITFAIKTRNIHIVELLKIKQREKECFEIMKDFDKLLDVIKENDKLKSEQKDIEENRLEILEENKKLKEKEKDLMKKNKYLEEKFQSNRSENNVEFSGQRDARKRHVQFLLKSQKEKESDLECPVCLETAGGEIFSCVEQHLVCSVQHSPSLSPWYRHG